MTDPKNAEPDEDLLEFLGGIDEVNEDSREGGFSDFLATEEIDKVAEQSSTPAKDGKDE